MDKMTLLIDKKDISLRIEGKSIRIDSPDKPMQRIPLGMVGQVVVYGNPSVGCNVWRKLSEMEIPSLLLPARGKGDHAWISPGAASAIMVRISQYKTWVDDKLKKQAVLWLIKNKLESYSLLLDHLDIRKNNYSKYLNQLEKASSIKEMRGIEGIAAKDWFAFLSDIVDAKWKFKKRNRRPPEDPVNSLLSLGYTMLMSEVRKSVYIRGVDPCLGFLHDPYPGRESFILDLVEPLRFGVDYFVIEIIKNYLLPDDFTNTKQDGCRLIKEKRSEFYFAWETFKNNWPILSKDKKHENKTSDISLISKNLVNEFIRTWDI